MVGLYILQKNMQMYALLWCSWLPIHPLFITYSLVETMTDFYHNNIYFVW